MGLGDYHDWLKCLGCGARLAPVAAHHGRTAIPIALLSFVVWIDRAEITCPACGQVRRFSSSPVKAGVTDVMGHLTTG